MKKVAVTIEFWGEDAEVMALRSGGVDVGVLLRDALGEFQDSRKVRASAELDAVPTVEGYVEYRYALSTERFRKDKVREVTKRCDMAKRLHAGAVTIYVSDVEKAGE